MKHSKATKLKMSRARKAYWANKKSTKLAKEWNETAKLAAYTSKKTLIGSVLGWFGLN